jgi:hypothetical protein
MTQNITLTVNDTQYTIDGDRLTNGGVYHSRIENFLAALANEANDIVPFVPVVVPAGTIVNLNPTQLLNVIRTGSASAGSISFGPAITFGAVAGSTLTNTGSSVITGSLGLSPGTSVTGFPPGTVTGSILTAGAAATQAAALFNAYTAAQAIPGATVLSASTYQLGGTVLTAGVYSIGTSAAITGNFTFNAAGNPNATLVIQIGSTLTTASASQVLLTNGAQAKNIIFAVGTSATIGTGSLVNGNILANASITDNGGSTVNGHLYANTGAVTLNDTTLNTTADYGTGGGSVGTPTDATIASAVINLPTTNNVGLPLQDGQEVTFSTTGAITTVTGTVASSSVITSFSTITGGSGYVAGTYLNVPLTGGTGSGALANIVVPVSGVASVTIASPGTGYVAADSLSASNTNLGGSGSGFAVVVSTVGALVVDPITSLTAGQVVKLGYNLLAGQVIGPITGGSGYINGTYLNVPLTGGNGSNGLATVIVAGGSVTSVTVTAAGTGYLNGNVLSASNLNLGGNGSGFKAILANATGLWFRV